MKEEIEVGEYIRDRDGCIIKVKCIQEYKEDDDIWYEEGILKGTWKSMTVKHSHNLIDLIEKDDYVNGKRVIAAENRINDDGEKVILLENYDEWTDDGVIANKYIKSVVTHEQFASMQYNVEVEE